MIAATPKNFLLRALVLAALFALVHALGWRDEMRFLSGTPASAVRGVIYGGLYFSAVLLAPALVLGALILAVLDRLAKSPEESS